MVLPVDLYSYSKTWLSPAENMAHSLVHYVKESAMKLFPETRDFCKVYTSVRCKRSATLPTTVLDQSGEFR